MTDRHGTITAKHDDTIRFTGTIGEPWDKTFWLELDGTWTAGRPLLEDLHTDDWKIEYNEANLPTEVGTIVRTQPGLSAALYRLHTDGKWYAFGSSYGNHPDSFKNTPWVDVTDKLKED